VVVVMIFVVPMEVVVVEAFANELIVEYSHTC